MCSRKNNTALEEAAGAGETAGRGRRAARKDETAKPRRKILEGGRVGILSALVDGVCLSSAS